MYSPGSSYTIFAFVAYTFLCIAAAEEAKTLTCWSCDSNTVDDPCVNGTRLNDTNVETCSGPKAACIKVFSHVYSIQSGDSTYDQFPPVVSRFCSKEHPLHDIGCAATDGIKGKQEICLCDNEDRCNSGTKTAVSLIVLSLATLFVRLL